MNQVSRYCTNCGHQLNVGRYCTNCGARVTVPAADVVEMSATDYPTAVRPGPIPPIPAMPAAPAAAPAPPPPPLEPAPSSARYPLYADSVPAQQPASSYAPAGTGPARRSPLPWLVAFLVLAVIAATGGALLLLGGSGDDAPERGDDRDRRRGGTSSSEPITPTDVTVPETAPASRDESGARVTFGADNMLDGDPRTSWRMAGNGTGATLVFSFDAPVTLTEVGIVNGYAKSDPPHDWYAGNRRIAEVVWVLDDGTEVIQELGYDPALQTTEVVAGPTRTVELRLLEVTDPGEGPDARDFTAISEIAFTGS